MGRKFVTYNRLSNDGTILALLETDFHHRIRRHVEHQSSISKVDIGLRPRSLFPVYACLPDLYTHIQPISHDCCAQCPSYATSAA